tara:strand:+ start:5930 stop:7522 length:1593 start_codon:yes stop_codon:yes gene_type:complete
LVSFDLPSNLKSDHENLLKKFINKSIKIPNDFLLENRLNEKISVTEYIDKYEFYYGFYGPEFKYIIKEFESFDFKDSACNASIIAYKIIPPFYGLGSKSSRYTTYNFSDNNCRNLEFNQDTILQRIFLQGFIKNSKCLNKECLIVFPRKMKMCSECNSSKNIFDFWDVRISRIENINTSNDYVKVNVKTSESVLDRISPNLKINNKDFLIDKSTQSFSYSFIKKQDIIVESSFPKFKSELFNYADLNKLPDFSKYCTISRSIEFKIPNNFFTFKLGYKYFNADYNFINKLSPSIEFNSLPSFYLSVYNNILIKKPFIFYYGIGLESVNFNFKTSLSGHKDVFLTSDPDAFTYLRKIDFINHDESLQNRYISIPFTLGLNTVMNNQKILFFNNLELDFKISFSPYFNYFATLNTTASINYSGYYESLFGLTIEENGVYDFGIYDFDIEKSVKKNNNYSIDYRLGFLKNISKHSKIKIGFSVGRAVFLNDFNDFIDNNYISTNNLELNSVFSNIESFKVNLNYFELSLNYQF